MTSKLACSAVVVPLIALVPLGCGPRESDCTPQYRIVTGIRDAFGGDVAVAVVGCDDALSVMTSPEILDLTILLQEDLHRDPHTAKSAYLELEFRRRISQEANTILGREVVTDMLFVTYFQDDLNFGEPSEND